MSLMKCSECGHDVSTKAVMCPNCGAPQEKQPARGRSDDPVIPTPPSEKFVDFEARTAPEKKNVAGKQYSLGKLFGFFLFGWAIYTLFTYDDSSTSTTYRLDPDISPQKQIDAIRADMRARNKAMLERNRAGITSEIKYLIANGEYSTAYRRAARFSKLNDDELKALESEAWEKHRRKQEKLLLAKLKHIPASEFKANADEYAKLAELFPENERYKKKLYYYRWKLREQNNKASVSTTNVNAKGDAKKDDVKQEIIQRCQSQIGSYGSAIVKSCVDQDIEALVALNKYPDTYRSIIGRCYNQMKEYGYAQVKACADHDIEAEKALGNY